MILQIEATSVNSNQVWRPSQDFLWVNLKGMYPAATNLAVWTTVLNNIAATLRIEQRSPNPNQVWRLSQDTLHMNSKILSSSLGTTFCSGCCPLIVKLTRLSSPSGGLINKQCNICYTHMSIHSHLLQGRSKVNARFLEQWYSCINSKSYFSKKYCT